MNKNTKIWLNYLSGGGISLILLYSIYTQVIKQLSRIDSSVWMHTGPTFYLWLCIFFMLTNMLLESGKWYLLVQSVGVISYPRAFCSYLAGIAFSIITPNRVGEYPGRIFYLGSSNTFRYINVSILGISAQLWSIYIFGFVGLIYYNIAFPLFAAKVALVACVIINILVAVIYFRFGAWVPSFEKIKWLRKFSIYGRLLNRITFKRQIAILSLSLLRFMVFTAQYLFLLRWMNVTVPPAEGFCMAALFFWILAVVPSIALTELGVRGTVSIYLFSHFSANTVGILAATVGIWLLNLILPSIFGSILIMRMKLLR